MSQLLLTGITAAGIENAVRNGILFTFHRLTVQQSHAGCLGPSSSKTLYCSGLQGGFCEEVAPNVAGIIDFSTPNDREQ